MPNPNWKKDGVSPNPTGRGNATKYKYSARTPLGALERFRQKIMTQKEAERLYWRLDAKDQLNMWQMVNRQLSLERLSNEELDMLLQHLKTNTKE